MKIQILNNVTDCVDGYTPVFIKDNNIDINVPQNSITSIIMTDTIEQISYDHIDNFIGKIRELLRINGEITITGIEVNCICRDLINKAIDCQTYNAIIKNKQSIYECSELINKLKLVGIQTEKVSLKGSIYELHAIRRN